MLRIMIIWFFTVLPTHPTFNRWRVSVRRFFGESIGKSSRLYSNVRLKGKIVIGENCYFNENVLMASTHPAKILIGNDVLVGPNVVMRNANHVYSNPNLTIRGQGKEILDILIEDDVWIASNVVILPGAVIRKGSVIGAGAVVRGEIPAYSVAVGVPAKVIKRRNEGQHAITV